MAEDPAPTSERGQRVSMGVAPSSDGVHNEVMSRSRRMPPLFEVMHEANKKAASGAAPGAAAAAPEAAAGPKGSAATSRVFPRITSVPEEAAASAASAEGAPTPLWDADHARTGRRVGIRLSFVGVWLALGIALTVMLVTAVIAYKAGAEDEKNRLLATRTDPPPSIDEPGNGTRVIPSEVGARPPVVPEQGASSEPRSKPSATAPSALPVFGDDPRQKGSNYLIVAKLFLKDATAAAQYLTENGIPSVVVPPEGVDSLKLQEDRRGNWLVIVRAGYSSEEYSKPAAEAQRAEVMKRVKQLGRRWKEDRKGASSFADSFWDKYGR